MPKYDEIDWEQAACRDSIYTDLFYSVEEQRSIQQYENINALRQICMQCPLWEKCLAYASEYEDYGVWGGMTSLEREAMREPNCFPTQLARALFDLQTYGIDYEQVKALVKPRLTVYERK